MQKKTCNDPRCAKYDSNYDGFVDANEMDNAHQMLELELREEKADSQRRMAWAAIVSMIVFTLCLFLPIVPETRVAALADLLGLFYIAQAGVVGAYMGVTAWMSKGTSSSTVNRFSSAPKAVPQAKEPEL